MTLGRRFFLYGIGFALGCVAVYLMLLRNREFPDWTPKGRVKESILKGEILLSDDASKADTVGIRKRIADASIDFGRSDVRSGRCKTYVLTDDRGEMSLSVCDSVVTLVQMR